MVGRQTTTRCMADPQEHLEISGSRNETKPLKQSQRPKDCQLTVIKVHSLIKPGP